MKRKNIQLDLKSCETLAIPPDQDENGCAYFLIRKCPRLKAVHLAEYGVFRAWGMGASRFLLYTSGIFREKDSIQGNQMLFFPGIFRRVFKIYGLSCPDV